MVETWDKVKLKHHNIIKMLFKTKIRQFVKLDGNSLGMLG